MGEREDDLWITEVQILPVLSNLSPSSLHSSAISLLLAALDYDPQLLHPSLDCLSLSYLVAFFLLVNSALLFALEQMPRTASFVQSAGEALGTVVLLPFSQILLEVALIYNVPIWATHKKQKIKIKILVNWKWNGNMSFLMEQDNNHKPSFPP